MRTPPQYASDADVLMGIRRSKYGRPLNYYIANQIGQNLYQDWNTKFADVPAFRIMHMYYRRRVGQACGIPWLASTLASMSELRHYDQAVMDVAQTAAMLV